MLQRIKRERLSYLLVWFERLFTRFQVTVTPGDQDDATARRYYSCQLPHELQKRSQKPKLKNRIQNFKTPQKVQKKKH